MLYAVGRRSGGGRVCLIWFNAFGGDRQRDRGRERDLRRERKRHRTEIAVPFHFVLSRFYPVVQRVSVRNQLRAPPRETEGPRPYIHSLSKLQIR